MAAIELDYLALRQGVIVAAAVAIPAGIVGLLVTDDSDLGWLGTLTVIVVIAGLTIGAAVAAGSQRVGAPLAHGIITALTVFAVVQIIGILRRALTGDELHWAKYLSSALFALFAGTLGGLIGARRPSHRRSSQP